MTYQNLQLQGRLATEAELKALEKQILALYKEAVKEADIVISKMYATTSGFTAAERYDWFISNGRSQKIQREVAAIFKKHDLQVRTIQNNAGKVAMSNNYYRQLYTSQWVERVGFQALNPNLINYAVTGQRDSWAAITNKFGTAKDWAPANGTLSNILKSNQEATLRSIRTTINAGVLSGKPYAETARQLSKVIGTVNGDKVTGASAKALRVVRTEGNRLLNAGAYAQSMETEKQGFNTVKMWDATLDDATRPAHGQAEPDNTNVPVKDPFIVDGEELMFPGDSSGSEGNVINCRCTYITLLEGNKPQLRRGRNPGPGPDEGKNEVMDYQNYDAWTKENGLTKNKYGQLIP